MTPSSLIKSFDSTINNLANKLHTLEKRKGQPAPCNNGTATVKTQEGDVYGFQCCYNSQIDTLLGYAKTNNATAVGNVWNANWPVRNPTIESGCMLSVANATATSVGFEKGMEHSVQAAANAENASNNHAMAIGLGVSMSFSAVLLGLWIYAKCIHPCVRASREDRASRAERGWPRDSYVMDNR